MVNGVEQRFTYPLVSAPVGAVVKQVRHPNGQGGTLATTYRYEGAALDARGRGSVGFAVVRATDVPSGIVTASYLRQDFPFAGSPSRSTVTSGSVTLVDTTYELATQTIKAVVGGGSSVFPYVHKTTSIKKDLNGSDLGTAIATDTFGDGWGNVTVHEVVTTLQASSYTSTVTTQYQNATSAWVAGLPVSVTTTAKDASGTAPARIDAHAYDAATGLVTSDSHAVGDAANAWVNTYSRTGNSFGLVNKIRQCWADPQGSAVASQCLTAPSTPGLVSRLTRDVDYDAKGRFVLTSRNALAQPQTQTFYAATGTPATRKDLNGLQTTFTANGFGRITKTVAPDGSETRSYLKKCDASCPANAVSALIADRFNGASRVRTPVVEYDDVRGKALQQLSWGFDGRQIVANTRYDARGRVYEIDQPRYVDDDAYLQERRGYDNLDRVTGLTSLLPDGSEKTATVSFQGVKRVLTDLKGQVRTETRDALGRLATVSDASSQGAAVTSLFYDPFGNLTKTKDPNLNEVFLAYDTYGRRTDLRDPDLGWVHFDLDPAGRMWKRTSPIQRAAAPATSTQMKYDVLDRMTDRTQSDQQDHWIYDSANGKGVGELAEAYTGPSTAKDYRQQNVFDTLGRLASTTTTLDGVAYVSSRSYDGWGRLYSTSARRAADATKTFVRLYNTQGDLAQLAAADGTLLWTLTSQDAALRDLSANLGNGLVSRDHYDPNTGSLDDSLVQVGTNGIQRFHEHLTFDPLGKALTRSGQYNYGQSDANAYLDTMDYDELNRLKSFQEWSQTPQTFSYDLAGNLKTKMDPSASTPLSSTYTYPAQGAGSVRPHAVQSITAWPGTFTYDDDGNELTSPLGLTASWTSFDMPIKITLQANGVKRYDQFNYGPEHERAKMISGNGTNVGKITYYAGDIEVETDANGVVTAAKTYWPMGLGVDIDAPGAATQRLWTHRDRQGSVKVSTDATGALVERLNYDAWGNRRYLSGIGISTSIGDNTDNKGFTGQVMLDNVDLIHLNGRVYDPMVGRFLSGDPLISQADNGQSYNRYSYVLNDPIDLIDPSGFQSVIITGCGSCWKTELMRQIDDLRMQFRSNATATVNNLRRATPAILRALSRSGARIAATQAGAAATGGIGEPVALVVDGVIVVVTIAEIVHVLNSNDSPDAASDPAGVPSAGGAPAAGGSPDPNDPNGRDNDGLTRAQRQAIKKVDNVINNNALPHDFEGVENEMAGRATGFDHVTEMRQSVRALQDAAKSLEGSLQNPNLSEAARGQISQALARANSMLGRMTSALGG